LVAAALLPKILVSRRCDPDGTDQWQPAHALSLVIEHALE
jgi:hypothetical protein